MYFNNRGIFTFFKIGMYTLECYMIQYTIRFINCKFNTIIYIHIYNKSFFLSLNNFLLSSYSYYYFVDIILTIIIIAANYFQRYGVVSLQRYFTNKLNSITFQTLHLNWKCAICNIKKRYHVQVNCEMCVQLSFELLFTFTETYVLDTDWPSYHYCILNVGSFSM